MSTRANGPGRDPQWSDERFSSPSSKEQWIDDLIGAHMATPGELALTTVAALAGWQTTVDRWTEIDIALGRLGSAWLAGDPIALRRAVVDLVDLAPPPRVRPGEPARVPPPPWIRDRTNRLVYDLSREAEPTREA